MILLLYSLNSTVIRELSVSQNQTKGCGVLTHHVLREELMCITAPYLSYFPRY